MEAYYLDMRQGDILRIPRANLEFILKDFTSSEIHLTLQNKVKSFPRNPPYRENYPLSKEVVIHPYHKRKTGGNRLHLKIIMPKGYSYTKRQAFPKTEVA